MGARSVAGVVAVIALTASCGGGVDGEGGSVSTGEVGDSSTTSPVVSTETFADPTSTTVRVIGWEPLLVTTFEGPGFLGRVVRVEFDPDWAIFPADVAVTVGAIAGTSVGPATLYLADGRELTVPAGTPGGNNCIELVRPEDWEAITGFENPTPGQLASLLPPFNCFLYGALLPDGAVAWFNVAREYRTGDPTATLLRHPVAMSSGLLVVDGGLGLVIAADVEVLCGNIDTIEDWLADLDDVLSRTVVEIDVTTGEVQRLGCVIGF